MSVLALVAPLVAAHSTSRGFVLGVSAPDKGAWKGETFIQAVLTRDIARDIKQHLDDGSLVGPKELYRRNRWDQIADRIKVLGLSARTPNSPFTVACLLTHRRAWTQILAANVDVGVVYEDDVVYNGEGDAQTYVDGVVATLAGSDEEWDLINLGRCWDFCDQQQVVLPLSDSQDLVRSPAAGCTHAYAVSRAGAHKLLTWSLPYVTPVDYLFQLLGRADIIRSLSVTRPSFSQQRVPGAHDPTQLNECDPQAGELREMIKGDMRSGDARVIGSLNTSWLHGWLAAQYMPSPANLPKPSTPKAESCKALEKYCLLVGGRPGNFEDPDEAALVGLFDDLKLDTFAIWGLQPFEMHTHRFIHGALNESLVRAFASASRQRRVCWFPSEVSLCQGEAKKLTNSLVFASPKHAVFTRDPLLANLPVDESNYYVFHEINPPQFAELKQQKRVVQWVVRGPDGNSPALDAEHYALQQSVDCDGITCFSNNVYHAPWGTRVRPVHRSDDDQTTASDVVHFVGTVWHLNQKAFCELVAGCNAAGVRVVRHGLNGVPDGTCSGTSATFEDDTRFITETEKRQLQEEGKFVPCFQGEGHFHGNKSYVSDRTIEAVALAQRAITNNKFSAQILNIPFAAAREMCALHSVPYAKSSAARGHTYVSRLTDILHFFLRHKSSDS